MLGQFLPAQAVQASEESVLFSLCNVLLFGHICTMIELQPEVNYTSIVLAPARPIQFVRAPLFSEL